MESEIRELPKIYEPMTLLKGFQTWNYEKKDDVFYFGYDIPIEEEKNVVFYIYLFRREKTTGVYYTIRFPSGNEDEQTLEHVYELLDSYKKTAEQITKKRDFLKSLFEIT